MIRDIKFDDLEIRKKLGNILNKSIFDVIPNNITEIQRYNVITKEVDTVYLIRYYINGKQKEIEVKHLELEETMKIIVVNNEEQTFYTQNIYSGTFKETKEKIELLGLEVLKCKDSELDRLTLKGLKIIK